MEKSEQPEWYVNLQEGPFTRSTFTLQHIHRIEDRLRWDEPKAGAKRNRYIAGAAGVLGVASAVGIGIYSVVEDTPAALSLPSTSPSAIGELSTEIEGQIANLDGKMTLYQLKSEVEVLPQPEAYTAMPALFTAQLGRQYGVRSHNNGFAQIVDLLSSQSTAIGWIPEWYLQTDPATPQSEAVEPYNMIVATPIAFRLYPGEPQPSGFELEPGKVVQVTAKYDDWMRVNIMTYDSPYNGDKWVPISALEPWDPAKAKEGILRPGAVVYNEKGEIQDGPPAINPIFIDGEIEDRYRIGAPGGYSGFINRSDFSPGPFLKVIDQTQAFDDD